MPACILQVNLVNGKPSVTPRWWYYDFGLQEVIKSLFGDKDFCKLRTTGRGSPDNDFYQSTEFQRLDAATGNRAGEHSSSCWEIGLDWANIFDRKSHSTGVLGIRCVISQSM